VLAGFGLTIVLAVVAAFSFAAGVRITALARPAPARPSLGVTNLMPMPVPERLAPLPVAAPYEHVYTPEELPRVPVETGPGHRSRR
jgi:hypothetical protein